MFIPRRMRFMLERDWDAAREAFIGRHRRILRIEYKRELHRYLFWKWARIISIVIAILSVGIVLLMLVGFYMAVTQCC